MASEPVSVENFVRAETNRMFAARLQRGSLNHFSHSRVPTKLDEQDVIRMNRDTLYSSAIIDISRGATLTVPAFGDRYLSVMVVNQDHYINEIWHEPGTYRLSMEQFDTPYVAVVARVLIDASDLDDVAAANAIQDGLAIDAMSSEPFAMPDYDEASFTLVRNALLSLASAGINSTRAFGRKASVDPVRHLLATAAGWGGLPETEALYIGVEPKLPVGEYKLVVPPVPVDGFWSISVYNADGFFEINDRNAYNINNITGAKDADGTMTVHFGGCSDERVNCLPIMEGWNYTVRLYKPGPELLDGSWLFPSIEPA